MDDAMRSMTQGERLTRYSQAARPPAIARTSRTWCRRCTATRCKTPPGSTASWRGCTWSTATLACAPSPTSCRWRCTRAPPCASCARGPTARRAAPPDAHGEGVSVGESEIRKAEREASRRGARADPAARGGHQATARAPRGGQGRHAQALPQGSLRGARRVRHAAVRQAASGTRTGRGSASRIRAHARQLRSTSVDADTGYAEFRRTLEQAEWGSDQREAALHGAVRGAPHLPDRGLRLGLRHASASPRRTGRRQRPCATRSSWSAWSGGTRTRRCPRSSQTRPPSSARSLCCVSCWASRAWSAAARTGPKRIPTTSCASPSPTSTALAARRTPTRPCAAASHSKSRMSGAPWCNGGDT